MVSVCHTYPIRGLRPILIIAMAGLWILFPAAFDSAAQQNLHHELAVEILHDAKTLRGIDTIRLPKGASHIRGLSSQCAHACRGGRLAH